MRNSSKRKSGSSTYLKYSKPRKTTSNGLTATPRKSRYITGDFREFNPKKYVGDINKPINYRSGYELKYMQDIEFNPSVVSWNYENIRIPYVMHEFDPKLGRSVQKRHIYIIDFLIMTASGKKVLVEVKPETKSPKTIEQIKQNFDIRKNAEKWKAAIAWSKVHGYEFQVVTEKNLF